MHFNQLTPAEHERLSLVIEEASEVIQIVGKIFRHGYESYSPLDENKTTNRTLLQKEIGDLVFAIKLMMAHNDIDPETVNINTDDKVERISNYLHHHTTEDAYQVKYYKKCL